MTRSNFLTGLVNDLITADARGENQPLPLGSRGAVETALVKMLVDPDFLHDHIRYLQKQLGNRYHYREPLDEPTSEAVLQCSLVVLDDAALAHFLLNPIALAALADEIEECQPPAWAEALWEDGLRLLREQGRTIPPLDDRAVRAAMVRAVGSLSRSLAEQLKAVHVSFHFQVADRLLIAPREMCHNCRLPFDIVTDLRTQGLTSEMFGRPGVYNLSGEAIKARAAEKSRPKPSLFTPVYGQECSSLLSMPFSADGRVVGLVKVENKQGLPVGWLGRSDRPFTAEEEELLRRSLDASSAVLAAAYRWVKDQYPNPDVCISREFDGEAA